MKLKTILFRMFVIFIGINISFVLLHGFTDSFIPKELIKARVIDAFDSGALIESVQLHRNIKHGSPVNQIGIDQLTECVNGLMLVSENDAGFLHKAIVPNFQTLPNNVISCRLLNRVARDQYEPSQLVSGTKARLWHGAEPFTAALLPKFEFYQISHLIRQLSHIGLTLLLGFAFYRSKAAGLALLPVTVIATIGSGLNVYGGIPNALPYTVALYLALLITWVQYKFSYQKAVYASVAGGSVMAFVYILDGSLILVLALLLFLLYFTNPEMSRKTRWKMTITLCSLFIFSFFLSFIFKQALSMFVLGPEQVWNDFTEYIGIRMDTAQGGKVHSHWRAFYDQVGVYDIATSWNIFLKDSIVYVGSFSWLAALGLATLISVRYKTLAAVSDMSIFMMIAFVVFFRYAAMIGHSYQHWFIVARYVFVFFAFGVSALIWMGLLYKRTDVRDTNDSISPNTSE
jgi:hypothetical protein